MKQELLFVTVADVVLCFAMMMLAMMMPDKKSSRDYLVGMLERRNEKRRWACERVYPGRSPGQGFIRDKKELLR